MSVLYRFVNVISGLIAIVITSPPLSVFVELQRWTGALYNQTCDFGICISLFLIIPYIPFTLSILFTGCELYCLFTSVLKDKK